MHFQKPVFSSKICDNYGNWKFINVCLEIERLDTSEMMRIFLVDIIRNNLYFHFWIDIILHFERPEQCVTFQQLCISSVQNSPEKTGIVHKSVIWIYERCIEIKLVIPFFLIGDLQNLL